MDITTQIHSALNESIFPLIDKYAQALHKYIRRQKNYFHSYDQFDLDETLIIQELLSELNIGLDFQGFTNEDGTFRATHLAVHTTKYNMFVLNLLVERNRTLGRAVNDWQPKDECTYTLRFGEEEQKE